MRVAGPRRYQVVVVGASLGGTEALQILLGGLRHPLPVPVVVALHLGPGVSRFDVLLGRVSPVPVAWAQDGDEAKPGRVYLVPGRSSARLEPDGTLTVRRLLGSSMGMVDELFCSATDALGPAVLALLLTGAGSDGAAGCRAVKAAGGTVIAQDEQTAAAFGMPRAVIDAGDADLVLPLGELPELLDRVVAAGKPLPTAETRAAEAIFGNGGEMGRLMAAIDWAATALGPVDRWSPTLRTVLSTVLAHPLPMNLLWGPDRVQLYNDACIEFMAGYHPEALGRPMAQTWTDVANDLESTLRRIERTGAAALTRDQPFVLHRTGQPEEVHVTFSYSAVRDNTTTIAVLGTVVETTAQVLAHRRLTTLHRLATIASADHTTDIAVGEDVVTILADNPHDVPFALLYLIDTAGSATLTAATGLTEGSPTLLPLITTSEASPWPLHATMVRGESRVVDDLPARFPGLAAGPWPQPPHTALVLPIGAAPQGDAPAGVLVVGASSHLALDAAYRQFFDLIAEHVGAALTAARARRYAHDRIAALAALNQAKNDFFANVSHEFRTPLTLMLVPLEQLIADLRSSPHAEPARIAHRNALRLLRLVNSLLSFAQLERGGARPDVRTVDDLATLTTDLTSVFRPAIDRAGLRYTVDCPPLHRPVQLDPSMWETVVLNLISNALKHTFTGGITVRLGTRANHVELVVADTGTGIPDDEVPHLFTRFHRVKGAKARSLEGSGIGLALTNQLVRQHHGSIRVRSTPATGTTFTVWIPYTQPAPVTNGKRANREPLNGKPADRGRAANTSATTGVNDESVRTRLAFTEEAEQWLDGDQIPAGILEAADPIPTPPGERDVVLVVDDNVDMRRYLRHLLSARYDVHTAADGDEALRTLAEHPAHLILADVMMPVLDGLTLLTYLRTDPALRTTPVILLTALADTNSTLQALAAGAHDYVVKPFTARELIARIEAQLALARLRAAPNP